MNSFLNGKWFAVCSSLVVGVATMFTVHQIHSPDSAGIGYQVGGVIVAVGCKDPCVETSYLVYECDHVNPLITAVCDDPDACLRSAVTLASCDVGEPPEDEECELIEDPNAIVVQQWVHSAPVPLVCVDNGPQPPPTVPSGPCIFLITEGKCFVDGCPGPITQTEPVRTGRLVCFTGGGGGPGGPGGPGDPGDPGAPGGDPGGVTK